MIITEQDEEINNLFNSKHTKPFEETTPEGNKITGKILLNHGHYHGSLLIETVNNEPVKQFIRGFPKIHYYDENTFLADTLYGYEKLDGTCVAFYKLYDSKGTVIEIVPKSRQKAILDPVFMEMLQHCNTYLLYQKDWDESIDVIYCELFGMLNEHTIPHKQTYIDLRLIGASNYTNMFTTNDLKIISQQIQIPMPKKVVSLQRSIVNPNNYYLYFDSNIFDRCINCTVYNPNELIQKIKEELDERNKIYKELKNNIYYEGIVLQNSYDGKNHYIKVKPNSFFEAAGKTQLSVPIQEIRKEIYKIINENITEYDDNYNEKEVISFINENLQEEYSEDDVEHPKTQKAIKKELRKYIDSISNNSINNIVDELIKESEPDAQIKDMMRLFATKYPMFKHRSGDVYFVLEKRLRKECDNK